jgi:tight adherence protein B
MISARRVTVAAVLAAVSAFGIAPALAQSSAAPSEQILAVDMTGATQTVVVRSSSLPAKATVTVNGVTAPVGGISPASQSGYKTDNVLVLDSSSTSAIRLTQIRDAARKYVGAMKPGERVAILSAGGVPQLEAALTTDVAVLDQAIANLVPSGGVAVFDAVATASRLLSDQGAPLRSVTVIASSADAGAKAAGQVARADALDADVSVNVVVLTRDDFTAAQAAGYQQLATDTGGAFVATADAEKLASLTATAAEASRSLYAVRFDTDQAGEGGNVVVDFGHGPLTAGFVPNALTVGPALRNVVDSSSGGLGFVKGGMGLTISLVFGAIAAALMAFAVGMFFVKGESRLQSVLQPYAESEEEVDDGNALARNALFQRAVNLTSNLAERQGLLVKAERALEQANLPLRAAEGLTFYIGVVLAAGVVGFLAQRSVLGALIMMALGVIMPPAVVNHIAKRRRKAFMMQLPDTLTLLAGTLKAGYSFMQGVEAVSREVEEPMGSELRRVVAEAQLGRPLEEALDASADRMASADFSWAVMAVRIQREVGGNLSELLITVAETMTARQRLRGEVAALTAEGKISAIVLGILPVGLGGVLFVINPEYMNVLLSDTIGRIMLGVACASALAGFAWMKKIINIDI